MYDPIVVVKEQSNQRYYYRVPHGYSNVTFEGKVYTTHPYYTGSL